MILLKSVMENKLLSVIIPTFNESKSLPLLLSDLSELRNSEILVIDSFSKDKTKEIASIYGAKFYQLNQKNRGLQMNFGAKKATGKWLLFIHADSRLKENWSEEVNLIMEKESPLVYFFKFKINSQKRTFRLLEFFVNLRCFFFKDPYGDQGLLIEKNKYLKNEGFKKIPLMEDIEFIKRIKKREDLICLRNSIYTSSRKWDQNNFLIQSFKNWQLRRKWLRGDSIDLIYRDYYKLKD